MENCAISLLEEARCRAEEGDQGFQGQTALVSMWYATCVVLRNEEEAEPKEFEELHVGGVDGICCQHFQVIMASILQRHRSLGCPARLLTLQLRRRDDVHWKRRLS